MDVEPQVWWVNQGSTFLFFDNTVGEYDLRLAALQQGKMSLRARVKEIPSIGHHDRVEEMKEGDLVVCSLTLIRKN